MPKRNGARVRTFGIDGTVLLSRRNTDQDHESDESCLCCNDELIAITDDYAFESLRLLRSFLQDLICVCEELESQCNGPDSDDSEKLFENKVFEFEDCIANLNLAADVMTPWAVWFASPHKRASEVEPAGMLQILDCEQFATYLQTELRSGGDFDSGGKFWRYAPGIAQVALQKVEEIKAAICEDDRLRTVAASDPKCSCKRPIIARLASKADRGIEASKPKKPKLPAAPKRQVFVHSFWEQEWHEGNKVAVSALIADIWPQESKINPEEIEASRIPSLLCRVNGDLLTLGQKISFHQVGSFIEIRDYR